MNSITPRFHALCLRQAARRLFSGCASRASQRRTVDEIGTPIDVESFRRLAVRDDQAIVLRGQVTPEICAESHSRYKHPLLLPALGKWFLHSSSETPTELSPYFRTFLAHTVPYELILSARDVTNLHAFTAWLEQSSEPIHNLLHSLLQDQINQLQLPPINTNTCFIHFEAPLSLLDAAVQFNKTQPPGQKLSQLYIAQASLSDLPHDLQLDVPTPGLLIDPLPTKPQPQPQDDSLPQTADIYNSSIWLGLQPTFTPWHRDPNPNLFVQLCSSKIVRLSPPQPGLTLFNEVMATKLGKPGGNAAIRGAEMMHGSERQAWLEAVWGPDAPSHVSEAVVNPGDALFIHKGWWHSVRSVDGPEGVLNASVNWWFRWRTQRSSSLRRGG